MFVGRLFFTSVVLLNLQNSVVLWGLLAFPFDNLGVKELCHGHTKYGRDRISFFFFWFVLFYVTNSSLNLPHELLFAFAFWSGVLFSPVPL